MKIKNHWIKLAVILGFVMMFLACTKTQKSQIILTIDGEKISLGEVSIYLLKVKEEFEKVAGEDVWEIEDFSGGKTSEQVAKEGALDNLIRDKLLEKKANSLGIILEESIIEETVQIAEEYYLSIPEEIIEKNHITKQAVIDSFKSYRVANEVSKKVSQNYEPNETQISEAILSNEDYVKLKNYSTEEILTVLVVENILLNTEEEAEEVLQMTKIGEDFELLIRKYSQEEDKEGNQGKQKMYISALSDEQKRTLLNLGIDQTSEIVKTDLGYTIYKLVAIEKPTQLDIEKYENEFNEWEKQLKIEAINKLRQEAFNEIYSEWKKESKIIVNKDDWEEISILNW